jgi:peptide/nickel transport system substrate-binding protein
VNKLTKRITAITLAATLLISGFASVSSGATARSGFDSKKVGGKVILTSFADAVSLTPLTASDSASNDIIGMVFEGLVTTDINGKPQPALAEKWIFDAKTLTYTFTLRKGVKFHDGKPFTSADVKFSYEMYMDPKSVNSYTDLTAPIKSVTAVDDFTVKFVLKEANAFFLTDAAEDCSILPKHQFPKGLDDYNNNNSIHRNPIGTGPFKFKQWKTSERIVLSANLNYWNGRPYLDEVITKILPDSNIEVLNLLKGDVDFVEKIDQRQLSSINKDTDLKTQFYDEGRFDFIGFNNAKEPFNDQKVRQALAYGLDRQSIVSNIFLGKAYLSSGPMHPKIPQNNNNVEPYPYDVKKAAALLDEAGWKLVDGVRQKNGKKFEIEGAYNNGNKIRENIMKIAQQNWKKLGIKVTIRSYEWSIFLDKYYKGQLDTMVLAWGGYDATVNHYGFFHSSQIKDDNGDGGNNSNRISDPKIDKILEDYQVEPDADKRNKLYQELHAYISEKEYLIFTHHPKQTAAMNKNLMNVQISMASAFYNIKDWYWKKGLNGR